MSGFQIGLLIGLYHLGIHPANQSGYTNVDQIFYFADSAGVYTIFENYTRDRHDELLKSKVK